MDNQISKKNEKEVSNYDRLLQVLVLADTVGLIGFAWYFSRRDNAKQEEIRQLKSELAEANKRINDLFTLCNAHKRELEEHEARHDNTEKFMSKIGDVKSLKKMGASIDAAHDDITALHHSLATANINVPPPSLLSKRSKDKRSKDKKRKGKKNKPKPPPSSSSSSSSSDESNSTDEDNADPYKVLDKHKSNR